MNLRRLETWSGVTGSTLRTFGVGIRASELHLRFYRL
jgi:hypothetical protein